RTLVPRTSPAYRGAPHVAVELGNGSSGGSARARTPPLVCAAQGTKPFQLALRYVCCIPATMRRKHHENNIARLLAARALILWREKGMGEPFIGCHNPRSIEQGGSKRLTFRGSDDRKAEYRQRGGGRRAVLWGRLCV